MALNHTALPQEESLPHYLRDGDPFASKLSWEADLVAGFYLTIIGILSTFGNGYVLYMSSRRKKKLRPAEIMTINLAVCDLGISGKPFTIISCFCHRWVFGWIGCRWYGWAGFFFGCGSLITMTAVSLDRYLKICYLSYGVWLKRKHAYICLAVIWAYASFWTTMPLVGLGDYAPEPFGTSCTLDWWLAQASVGGQIFILNILFFCLLLPTAVIVFSYVKIIAKVKSSSKEVAHFDSRIHSSHVLEVKLTKDISKSVKHSSKKFMKIDKPPVCQKLLQNGKKYRLISEPEAEITPEEFEFVDGSLLKLKSYIEVYLEQPVEFKLLLVEMDSEEIVWKAKLRECDWARRDQNRNISKKSTSGNRRRKMSSSLPDEEVYDKRMKQIDSSDGVKTRRRLTDVQLITLAGKLGEEWMKIAIANLELEISDIDEIQGKKEDATICKFRMLKKWQEKEQSNATAQTLYNCLKSVVSAEAQGVLEGFLQET